MNKGKKDFGLAAQLVRGRPTASPEPALSQVSEPSHPPVAEEEATSSASTKKPQELESVIFPKTESLDPMPPKAVTKPIGRSGRPRREEPTQRMTLILSQEMATYLEDAWRTHRRTNGQYVNGPSAFIEELLRLHRNGTLKTF